MAALRAPSPAAPAAASRRRAARGSPWPGRPGRPCRARRRCAPASPPSKPSPRDRAPRCAQPCARAAARRRSSGRRTPLPREGRRPAGLGRRPWRPRGGQQAAEDPQQGGLAGSRPPHDGHELTVGHVEVDASEDPPGTLAGVELHAHAAASEGGPCVHRRSPGHRRCHLPAERTSFLVSTEPLNSPMSFSTVTHLSRSPARMSKL